MRQLFVAGNWKMNGSKASITELVGGILEGLPADLRTSVCVCPPFPFLGQVEQAIKGSPVTLGAQNLSNEASGAFTGEVAASMLQDFGVSYCIVGHSERRAYYGEDDALVARKYQVAADAGFKPILCVGETLEEREGGITEQVVGRQLDALIEVYGVDALTRGVIAYEPVWAIGTGKTASPEQAQDVHAFIRNRVAGKDQAVADAVQILYGGSVKPDNAAELFGQADIDGGLIGGASLKASDFLGIILAANQLG